MQDLLRCSPHEGAPNFDLPAKEQRQCLERPFPRDVPQTEPTNPKGAGRNALISCPQCTQLHLAALWFFLRLIVPFNRSCRFGLPLLIEISHDVINVLALNLNV
jgi:hypothetical protein